MRISPIEQPQSLFMRFVYWMSKRKLGKVITPIKVFYARKPGLLWVSQLFTRIEEKQLKLNRVDALLYKAYVAHLNECDFCEDIAKAFAMSKKLDVRKFSYFDQKDVSGVYSAADLAVFAFLEEANQYKKVSEATFQNLNQYFDTDSIIEITWLLAVENYYNLMNKAFEVPSDELCRLQ